MTSPLVDLSEPFSPQELREMRVGILTAIARTEGAQYFLQQLKIKAMTREGPRYVKKFNDLSDEALEELLTVTDVRAQTLKFDAYELTTLCGYIPQDKGFFNPTWREEVKALSGFTISHDMRSAHKVMRAYAKVPAGFRYWQDTFEKYVIKVHGTPVSATHPFIDKFIEHYRTSLLLLEPKIP